MKVRVLYFARLREELGCAAEEVALPADVDTVAALRSWLAARGPTWASALAPTRRIRAALNHDMVSDTAALIDGAEVAFFPPVTGG